MVSNDQPIATHRRCFGRSQMIFDPWHYVPVLQYKPGALRNGAPFANWDLPKVLLKLKVDYLKREGGDREFVQLLLMIQQYGLETVTVACELAVESGTTHLSVITNIVHRLIEPVPSAPLNITEAPVLRVPPIANVERYDQLCPREVSNA